MNPSSKVWSTSPGQVIAEELEARGWSAEYFCQITKYSPEELNKMLSGEYVIHLYDSVVLGRVFDTSAIFWQNLENNYQAYLRRKAYLRRRKC